METEDMLTVAVASTAIKLVSYDRKTREMIVYFNKGDQRDYHFYDVPEEIFNSLVQAKSVGTYYAQHVKGRFPLPNPEVNKEIAKDVYQD